MTTANTELLERFTLMTVGAIRSAGLRLDPTGRNFSHYDVGFDDLDDGITRLCACEHRVVVNSYHEP